VAVPVAELMALQGAVRLSWPELREQCCCCWQFTAKSSPYGNSTANSLGY